MVDIVSDLHLQEGGARHARRLALVAWARADALFILGDLFEVWVGDDAAEADGFEHRAAQWLRDAAWRMPVHFLHGNRDFLVGQSLADATGVHHRRPDGAGLPGPALAAEPR